MHIHHHNIDTILVVSLEGELDGKTAPIVQEQVLPLCQDGNSLVLDMHNVPYMSSAGLRLMLSFYRQISAGKGKIVLVGMVDELQDTMQATGFLRYFTLYDTVDEAVAALQ